MSEPVIEVRHLSKSFGTHVVLRDVDFTVNAGDVTCIIGASGSGKSTLLRCINLLETPTNGKVLFHGSDITAKGSDPCAYRAKVGMVFQSFNLFNNMTVLDNCTAGLRYVLHQDKETAKKTALENLEKVYIPCQLSCRRLSVRRGIADRLMDAHASRFPFDRGNQAVCQRKGECSLYNNMDFVQVRQGFHVFHRFHDVRRFTRPFSYAQHFRVLLFTDKHNLFAFRRQPFRYFLVPLHKRTSRVKQN